MSTAAISQGKELKSSQESLLDNLVGIWNAKGIVHGSSTTQTLQAEWVLHHQFLRLYEKSAENISGQSFPFEGVYFIGYDRD